MTIGRSIFGALSGVFAAGAVIAGVEAAGHGLASGESVFAVAILGYGLGALAGSALAFLIAGRQPSIAVPVLLGILGAINLFAFPHPVWFVPATIVVLAAGWLAGTRLAARRAA